MPDLELRNLTKSYGNSTPAVDDMSVTIGDGEFVALLGPSGCGKSTTLRMIAGLEKPDAGGIYVGKKTLTDCKRRIYEPAGRRNLGMVFQSYAIWPHMTVGENVGYPLKLRKVSRSERNARVDEVLDLVDLPGLRDRPAPNLSGGQQQRVALARALVFAPQMLLLDEPLSNLDAKLRDNMRLEIAALQERLKITTLYVTHDQDEALTLADRIVVMNKGNIEQIGDPGSIYDHPATEFVARFIGRTNFVEISQIQRHLDGMVSGVIPAPGNATTVIARASVSFDRNRSSGTLGVRPERISFYEGRPDAEFGRRKDNLISGKVAATAFHGDHIEYLIDLGGSGQWRIFVSKDMRIETGALATLSFDGEDASVY